MTIKDANGNMVDVASQNVGGWGLGLGIAGTALGLANHGGGGLGLFGGGNYGNYANAAQADEISKLRMENAILHADNTTDKKLVEVYTQLAQQDSKMRDRIDALREELGGKITAEREARLLAEGAQAVINAQVETGIAVLKNQQASMAATIASITETVIPQRKICDTSCCGCNN